MTNIRYNEHDPVELNYVPSTGLYTEDTLRQMLAFDIAPDSMLADLQEDLGLQPCSEEVLVAEMNGSQARRNAIVAFAPLLVILSRLSSETLNRVILVRKESEPDLDVNEVTPAQILAASKAILASLVDMGVVSVVTTKGFISE